MKRLKQFFVLHIMFLLIACSKVDQPREWINVANSTNRPVIEFYQIKDIDRMNTMNEFIGGLKWQDRQIDTVGGSDYTFWLEREKEERRITNYEIWINDYSESAVIVDYVQGKYATIDGVELEQIIQFLESGHSDNR